MRWNNLSSREVVADNPQPLLPGLLCSFILSVQGHPVDTVDTRHRSATIHHGIVRGIPIRVITDHMAGNDNPGDVSLYTGHLRAPSFTGLATVPRGTCRGVTVLIRGGF